MSDLADWVFEQELSACRSAVDDNGNQDAKGRCRALIERYPHRPEPRELLGRHTYRNASREAKWLTESLRYFQEAFELYNIEVEEQGTELHARYSVAQLMTLREVTKGIGVTTAELALRKYVNGEWDSDKAIAGLIEAGKYFKLGLERTGMAASDEYRVAIKSYLGVIQVYLSSLGIEKREERLAVARKEFQDARALGTARAKWVDYSIFVVAAWQCYGFGDEDAKVIAKKAITNFLKFLPKAMTNKANIEFKSYMGKLLTQIVKNEREDEYVISRLIGSRGIGGNSIKAFFDEHPNIKRKVLEVAKKL